MVSLSNRRFSRRKSRRVLRRGRFNKRKFYKRVIKRGTMTLMNRSKPSLNIPINPRYLTKFVVSGTGSVPAPGAGFSSGIFALKLNSPLQPNNASTALFTGTANNSGVFLGGTLGGQNARGFSNLCSLNMYNKFRVYASKIKITCIPRAVTDSMVFCVYPVSNGTFNPTISATLDQSVAYSKELIASSNADMNRNTIISYIDLQSLDGLTREQLMSDDTKVGTFSTDPSDLSLWIVKYQNTSNANFTNNIGFNWEITYYTELFEMNYENMSVL